MSCLICSKTADIKLCDYCGDKFLYDSSIGMIRRKKTYIPFSTENKESMGELRLHNILCKIYGRKNVFRNVHPLWAISSKGVLLEYDVAIPSEKLLIEYDGIQHYKYPNFFHKTKKEYLAQVRRDKKKNKLAKDNGWKLVRFKYNENIDKINIERKLKLC